MKLMGYVFGVSYKSMVTYMTALLEMRGDGIGRTGYPICFNTSHHIPGWEATHSLPSDMEARRRAATDITHNPLVRQDLRDKK